MDLIDDNTILVAGESGLDMVMHKVYLYDITFDWGTDDFNGDFTQDGESKTLTIINASPASLTIGDRVLKATSSGATGAELSIDDSQCIGIITATSSCVVTITFNPQNYELSSSSYELSFTTLHTSAEVAAATITTAFDHTLDTDHTSVYRFWNATTLSHFYTVDINEVNYLKANNPAWAYEGPVFTVVKYDSNAEACNLDGSDEVFRFYNTVYGVHFYTADSAEKDYIISTNPNWDYEGVAYCAYKEEATGTTPVYQFWSVARQAHFYTTDAAEKAYVESELGDIYNYEGIVYYVIAL